jgi:hypothetical protein
MEVIEMSKDGYNINEPPTGNILPKVPPKAPPTTEYVGGRTCKGDVRLGSGCGACSRCFAQMKELALLPSERRELNERIKEANLRFDLAYSQACSKFTRIINESNLTVEEKQDILNQLWK